MSIVRQLNKPSVWFALIGLTLLALHFWWQPSHVKQLGAELLHRYSLTMSFDAANEDIVTRTYLPLTNDRQEVINESLQSGTLEFTNDESLIGRQGIWKGFSTTPIRYNAIISSREQKYEIDPELDIPTDYPPHLKRWLEPTEFIQVNDPRILELWMNIQPKERKLLSTLEAIHDYTYNEIEGAPFKGTTDAITTMILKRASCNGKSRLFAALARLNGIPTRLVGGVILETTKKKTSHQWVEAYIQGHWVPFDPLNDYFAQIPHHYLELYIDDQALFSHTRNINFDYIFDIKREHIAAPLLRFDNDEGAFFNAASLLAKIGIENKTAGIFLLFPFVAFLISFARNVLGVKTFGIFMPMLVSAACIYTGFWMGLGGFVGVLLTAWLGQLFFDRHKLLKIPRLAAIITLNTMLFIAIFMVLGDQTPLQMGMMTLFPVVIISFIAERLSNMTQDNNWRELFITSLGSVVMISLCYLAFSSITLQSFFALYPESLLLVMAAQIFIGQWTGLRISEYLRFKKINTQNNTLGINKRNRDYVYQLNERKLLQLAIDKIETKKVLLQQGVPVPQTLDMCDSFRDLDDFVEHLRDFKSFVVKPNRGSQGNGILVIVNNDDGTFVTASGKRLSLMDIRYHVSEIITGNFAQDGAPDTAYIEPLLIEHHRISEIANLGLSDIRVILCNQEIISCMLRVPTKLSEGKANLHQGAIGLSVDIETGLTAKCSFKGKQLDKHPDSGSQLLGHQIPFWNKIKEIAQNAQKAIPLGYIGVDICIDEKLGPMVLEVNGRPGLEIQNVQHKGFSGEMETARDRI
ncbi:sugar-transfer associated ATP-grasp domain-containing protein [Kangiella sediminilitoris]|uniref:ATP-grasp domain-containing protein n=1 Tax=Kangiella sediminilitoris TaxID=1144748 RepID=A0A1B3BA29_9GAMM|nr:sugar-transfer associated ATP-grasp domain-containing protein [Kangiella sediminilitoris]AOE49661.1 hypothetical protein KS2013_939 [Kangiella sediminilitoris]